MLDSFNSAASHCKGLIHRDGSMSRQTYIKPEGDFRLKTLMHYQWIQGAQGATP